MISYRQADLLDTVTYDGIWRFIRGLKQTNIPLIVLFRVMWSDMGADLGTAHINGLPQLPSKINGNFEIIPPEMREWLIHQAETHSAEAGSGSLRQAKFLHDDILTRNTGSPQGYLRS